MRSLEGDIVGVVVVVVVVSVGMENSTVSSSACAANVDSSESPRSALHARTRRERRSEAAPTTALAPGTRGDALPPRVPVSAGAAESFNASRGVNLRVAPLRLSRLLM